MTGLFDTPELYSITLEVDDKGYRTYKVVWQVRLSSRDEYAYSAYLTAGLPVVGSLYSFGSEFDPWCWCRPEESVSKYEDPQGTYWRVTQTFSNKPLDICREQPMMDPLTEPYKISGSFQIYQAEATYDQFGNPLQSSSFEPIRGPQVEFDKHRAQVKIEQNVPDVQLPLITQMMNTVNDAPLWGVGARCVKLSGCPWERKFWGQCELYYTRTLEFDIDFNLPTAMGTNNDNTGLGGFDRIVLDEGTKVVAGHWGTEAGDMTTNWVPSPVFNDKANPTHWMLFTDRTGNPAHCIVTEDGFPIKNGIAFLSQVPNNIQIQYYPQSDFTQLAIPISIGTQDR